MSYGFALGANHPVSPSLAEGRYSAKHLQKRAIFEQVEMPICQAVDKIITQKADINKTVAALLARSAGSE